MKKIIVFGAMIALGSLALLAGGWDNDFINCEEIEGTDGRVATGLTYVLESARGGLLDSGKPNSGARINPKARKSWNWAQWRLIPTGRPGYYALESVRGGLLDSGKPGQGARINPKARTSWNWAQWRLVPTGRPGYFALESARGGLLDSGNPNAGARINSKAKTSWNWAQWKLTPVNYNLSVALTDFDFGGEDHVLKLLKGAEKLAINDVSNLTVKTTGLGAKIGGSYGETVEESFSWGLEQKLGYEYSTTVTAGLPVGGEGSVSHTFSAEFGAHQDWSTTTSRSFTKTVEMSPTEPGVYQLGHLVYVAEDVELPFKAKATLEAKVGRKSLSAAGVLACFLSEGLDTKVLDMDDEQVEVEVSGKMEATYGVRSVAVAEKVGNL